MPHFRRMRQKENKYSRPFKSFILKTGLLFVVSVIFSIAVMAQGPGGDPEGDPDLVPLDGGLVFLLAAGVGYGVKKVKESREEKSK